VDARSERAAAATMILMDVFLRDRFEWWERWLRAKPKRDSCRRYVPMEVDEPFLELTIFLGIVGKIWHG
jgi:hypothetical protein